jgi:uncharacterized protein YbaR (Trm112 family)
MLKNDLFDLLVCPESRQRVKLGDQNLIDSLNAKIRSGQLVDQSQRAVTEALDAVLVREDGKLAYPIRQGIPVMLTTDAFVLSQS